MIDFEKSLTEIENDDWGRLQSESELIEKCHNLRYKKLGEFTPEDCRILISQGVSVELVAQVACKILKDSPFVETDFGPGSLLLSFSSVDRNFWSRHPTVFGQVKNVVKTCLEEIEKYPKTGFDGDYLTNGWLDEKNDFYNDLRSLSQTFENFA